ncbi:MAG: HD domain-containing protein [Chloroflexi bacterium]|nr:HD domain-containing protein [Chloroflexota bacterium]
MLSWFWRHAGKDAAFAERMYRLGRFLFEARSLVKEMGTAHCEVGEMLARRLGFSEDVQQTVRCSLEHWNGTGPVYGLKGDEVPVTARIIHIAQVLEVGHRFGGKPAALEVARQRRGKDFDPVIVDAFLKLALAETFWEPLKLDASQKVILDMRPQSHFDLVSESQVDTVCEVIADFSDIRTTRSWNHSQKVAGLAVAIAQALGLSEDRQRSLRRAALVHDLGKAAIPDGILEKQETLPEALTEADREQFRLHPYYTERILSRIDRLGSLIPEAAAHHERIDGQGYHRRLSGDQIPLGGRILAVADTYELLSKAEAQDDPQATLRTMQPLAGSHLDRSCYEALAASLVHGKLPARRPTPSHSLSDRELEVLQELAKGLTNRQIAKALVISENTVERHLDNIYGKLGVSCRTSAVVWAVQGGLIT